MRTSNNVSLQRGLETTRRLPEVFGDECQKYHQIVEVKPTNFSVTEHSFPLIY